MTNKPVESRMARGTISGFSTITVGDDVIDNNNVALDPVTLTLPEVLEQLRFIHTHFDPNKLYKLEQIMQGHIHDYTNPHKITAQTLGLDTFTDLYNLWVKEGWGEGVDNFKKVIFQELEIGTLNDILNRTMDKLVTYDIADKYFEYHSEDPSAHTEMIQYHLPGTAKVDMPAYGLYGIYGLQTDNWSVIGDPSTIVSSMNNTGYIDEYQSRALATDYSSGYAKIIACGVDITNMIAPSHPYNQGAPIVGGLADTGKSIYADNKPNTALTFKDTPVVSEHSYTTKDISVEAGKTYTFSVYIAPYQFPLSITDNQYIDTAGIRINSPIDILSLGVDNKEIYLQNFGYETTGYIRVGYTFKAMTTGPIHFIISALDPFGNKSFAGSGKTWFTLDALQLEEYTTMSPHIRNMTNVPYTRKAYLATTRLTNMDFVTGTFGANIDPLNVTGTAYTCDTIKATVVDGKYTINYNLLGNDDLSYPISSNMYCTWFPGSLITRCDSFTMVTKVLDDVVRLNVRNGKHITIGGEVSADESTILNGCLVMLDNVVYFTSKSTQSNMVFLSGEYSDVTG